MASTRQLCTFFVHDEYFGVDVTREVVKRAPKGVAEFWSHGELALPPGVEVIEKDDSAGLAKGAYRENARDSTNPDSIVLTFTNDKLAVGRVVGPLMILIFGCIFAFLWRLDPHGDTSVIVAVGVLCGLPVLGGIYLTLVGFLNRWRIHLDRNRLRIDQGPVPYPHKKIELSNTSILRLSVHQSTWTGRGSVKRTDYSIAAWLPGGRRTTFLDSLSSPTMAMYLQHRMADFLELPSRLPVDIAKE